MAEQIPLVSYLELGDTPTLVAQACDSCGARFFGRRNACAHCGVGTTRSVHSPSCATSRRVVRVTDVCGSTNASTPRRLRANVVRWVVVASSTLPDAPPRRTFCLVRLNHPMD